MAKLTVGQKDQYFMGGKNAGKVLVNKDVYGFGDIEQVSLTYMVDLHKEDEPHVGGTVATQAVLQARTGSAEPLILDASPEYRTFTLTSKGLFISDDRPHHGGPTYAPNPLLLASNPDSAYRLFRDIHDLPLNSKGRNLYTLYGFWRMMTENIDL